MTLSASRTSVEPSPFNSHTAEQPFVQLPFDPERYRELIRGTITITAMLIFAVVVSLFVFASFKVSGQDQWSRVKEAMQAVLPAVTSVLGTALGFYFGSQKR